MILSSLPCKLAADLQQAFGLQAFVETGTAWGDTAELAAGMFAEVHTVELALRQFITAKRRLTAFANVQCFFGHSPYVLKRIVSLLSGPTLFWLDAHYSGGGTAKKDTECPLLAELNVIPAGHVIMVDDAHMFLADPPAGHAKEDWPKLVDIERHLPVGSVVSLFCNQILVTPREYEWLG